MNYNIHDLYEAKELLQNKVKNKTLLPWIDHLLNELMHDVSLKSKDTLHVCNLQEDMLRNAKSFKHYIQSAMSDIVGNYELLLRHYQNQKKADEVFNQIINGVLNSDQAINLAAQDMQKAASIIIDAIYLITNIQYNNKKVKNEPTNN